MADEELIENEEENLEEEETFMPSGGKKTIIILSLGGLLIVVAIILVVFVIYPKYQQMMGVETDETEEVEEIEEPEGPLQVGEIYKIEGLTINPRGTLGSRFAVFEVALEYENPELAATLTTLKPIIMDRYLTYLRTKTVMELSRPTLVDSIRADLKKIINDMLNNDEIVNLYFTRFVLE